MIRSKTGELCLKLEPCLKQLSGDGNKEFFYAMARCYREGIRVKKNINAAIELFEIVVNNSEIPQGEAMWKLACLYDYCQKSKDEEIKPIQTIDTIRDKMIEYYERATKEGVPLAKNDLARHYFRGVKYEDNNTLLEKDVFEAFRLVRESMNADCFVAYDTIADEHSKLGIYELAIKNYKKSIDLYKSNYMFTKYEWKEKIKPKITSCKNSQKDNVRDSVFISYSHKNGKTLDNILPYLYDKVDENKIWWDRKIKDGDSVFGSIEDALSKSKAILVLLSNDYLNSTPCTNEWTYAFESAEVNLMKIFILPLEKCDDNLLRKFRFYDYRALLDYDKPLNPLSESEIILKHKEIANKIKLLLGGNE